VSEQIIKQALNNVISAIQKIDDAPMSAETHINTAIVQLLSLCDSFFTSGERGNVILFAIGENLDYLNWKATYEQANKSDAINPKHYTAHKSGIECIEITRHLSFARGNAIKYLWRCGKKDSLNQELKKAIWYLNDELINGGNVDYGMNTSMILSDKLDVLAEYESAQYIYLLKDIIFGQKETLKMAIHTIEGMCDD